MGLLSTFFPQFFSFFFFLMVFFFLELGGEVSFPLSSSHQFSFVFLLTQLSFREKFLCLQSFLSFYSTSILFIQSGCSLVSDKPSCHVLYFFVKFFTEFTRLMLGKQSVQYFVSLSCHWWCCLIQRETTKFKKERERERKKEKKCRKCWRKKAKKREMNVFQKTQCTSQAWPRSGMKQAAIAVIVIWTNIYSKKWDQIFQQILSQNLHHISDVTSRTGNNAELIFEIRKCNGRAAPSVLTVSKHCLSKKRPTVCAGIPSLVNSCDGTMDLSDRRRHVDFSL